MSHFLTPSPREQLTTKRIVASFHSPVPFPCENRFSAGGAKRPVQVPLLPLEGEEPIPVVAQTSRAQLIIEEAPILVRGPQILTRPANRRWRVK